MATPALSNADNPHGRGWYTRGYLPHYDDSSVIQFITWRLAGSLPEHVIEDICRELDHLRLTRPELAEDEHANHRRQKFEAMLDRGYGACCLRRPRCAEILRNVLMEQNDQDYHLHAWVIMPNHVHVLVMFREGYALADAVEAWKGASSLKINEALGREGQLWQEDYWDRYIRSELHFQNVRRYIHLNPVKAGLVKNPRLWKWSSVGERG